MSDVDANDLLDEQDDTPSLFDRMGARIDMLLHHSSQLKAKDVAIAVLRVHHDRAYARANAATALAEANLATAQEQRQRADDLEENQQAYIDERDHHKDNYDDLLAQRELLAEKLGVLELGGTGDDEPEKTDSPA